MSDVQVSAGTGEQPGETTTDDVEAWFDEEANEGEGEGQGDGEGDAGEGEGEGGEGGQQQPDPYAAAPEFWSAERKALWEKIQDPELRQALHEIDRERTTATSKKIEEAALGRKDIETKLATFTKERDELAQWWQQMAPRLAQTFKSRWEGVDWDRLAAEKPAEWAALKQQQEKEFNLLRQAHERHQGEMQAANQRATDALNDRKREEHAKLVKDFPDHFGGDKAQPTYDALRDYLIEQGLPQDRIPHVYERAVVGVALKAMLYDRAKAEAAKKRNPQNAQQQPTTATQTPRRIPPGPARTGNPSKGERTRQAEQRLRTGQTLNDDDVAELFG